MNKEVLAWDLYSMIEGRAMYSLRDVPLRFSSVDEYLDIFEPLLLEECRAQTLRSLHESVGVSYHLQLRSVEPHEPFRLLHYESPELPAGAADKEDDALRPTDLVFVSYEPLDLGDLKDAGERRAKEGEEVTSGKSTGVNADETPEGDADGAADRAQGQHEVAQHSGSARKPKGQQFHALALVVNVTYPGTLILKVYLPEEPTCRLPPSQHKRLQLLRKVMVPDSGSWYVHKIGNMVRIKRTTKQTAKSGRLEARPTRSPNVMTSHNEPASSPSPSHPP